MHRKSKGCKFTNFLCDPDHAHLGHLPKIFFFYRLIRGSCSKFGEDGHNLVQRRQTLDGHGQTDTRKLDDFTFRPICYTLHWTNNDIGYVYWRRGEVDVNSIQLIVLYAPQGTVGDWASNENLGRKCTLFFKFCHIFHATC